MQMREDDYLINGRPQIALQTYKRIQMILFSYSFLITVVSIIFIALFTWKMLEKPLPEPYEGRLSSFIATTCAKPLQMSIDENDYIERRQKLGEALVTHQFDGFVAEPSASMLYFTSVRWKHSERPFLFVKTLKSDFWLVPAFELTKARENIPGGMNATNIYTWKEEENVYEILHALLKNSSNVPLKIAVAPETRLFIQQGISRLSDVDVRFGDEIERGIRMIKSAKEINIMRCANTATKQVIKVLFDAKYIRVGVTQSWLKWHVENALKAVGLRDVWSLVLFGSNAAFPHGTDRDLVLGHEDYVLLDIGGSLFNYQSDISRTFRVSRGTPEIDEAWKVVMEAQAAAFAAIKPGVTCASIDDVARKIVEAKFPGTFTHRLGHGIGIQGHEDPYFVKGYDLPLKAGYTLSVEPGIYVAGKFGIRLEDIIVVTDTGCEVFGSRPKSVDRPVE